LLALTRSDERFLHDYLDTPLYDNLSTNDLFGVVEDSSVGREDPEPLECTVARMYSAAVRVTENSASIAGQASVYRDVCGARSVSAQRNAFYKRLVFCAKRTASRLQLAPFYVADYGSHGTGSFCDCR
jgi:hypothetical protein